MDIGVYSIKDLANSQVEELLREKKSFVLEGIDRTNFSEAVETVEKLVEALGMKCRVYTKGRKALMVGAVTPNPVTFVAGVASAVAIGAHNVATWSPDYEIGKNLAMGTLTIEYQK
ncbi:hypothetical protein [Pseudoxanthomonas mexicana]